MTLAQTYQLGEPQQEYLASFPLDPHGRTLRLTILVWLLTLPIVFFPKLILSPLGALPPVLTLLIWAVAFLRQLYYKRTRYQRVYLCTLGLLCQRANAIDVIHWHLIKAINYDTAGNCRIHDNDGAVLFFSSPLQRLGELCTQIEQATIPYHLPQLLTSYRDGLPIVFGPLLINQQGIGLTEKNVTLFSWDKIEGIERRFDNLLLNLHNNQALVLPLTVHEIPSINLVQALMHALLDEKEQVTQELQDIGKSDSPKGKGRRLQKNSQELSPRTTINNSSDGPLTNIMGDPIGSATSDKRSIVIYERGFLYLNKVGKKLEIVRWDQVSQVLRRTKQTNGLVEYSIEVIRNDETTFVFPYTQPSIVGIGLYVEQKAAEWALPALLKQYDAGETTAFGKLTINQTGITYNKRSLAWSEVYQIRILQPNSVHIGIKQRGYKRDWQFIAISKIPDVFLLKLLVDHILYTHPAIQR